MRIEKVRAGVFNRLRERRAEIEQAALIRVREIDDPTGASDPEYAEGLRSTVAAAIDYGIDALGRDEDRVEQIPIAVLAQARLAARHGVALETVLRRYLAGYTLLGDFLIEEVACGDPLDGTSLKRLLRVQASLFDRMIAAVSDEYGREESRSRSPGVREAERVSQLLAGELRDLSEIAYDFSAWHVGAIAVGQTAEDAARDLLGTLDCSQMVVRRSSETVWTWFGARRRIDPAQLAAPAGCRAGNHVALGEPARGLGGWRLTHRQALAALPIALRSAQPLVRYGNVAVLASLVHDDLLATSLRQIYLAPLERGRDSGSVARETLRAYFASGRHTSSAAAALGVSRQTVGNRLRAIEERVGRTLDVCAAELEIALRLEGLETSPHLVR